MKNGFQRVLSFLKAARETGTLREGFPLCGLIPSGWSGAVFFMDAPAEAKSLVHTVDALKAHCVPPEGGF